jgi:MinD-like ATPase involved in chromosome partitioning or flagellar assembly
MAKPRRPLTVLAAGAEGGVGTTTVAALLGETIAAASPGLTWLLDQCGCSWGSLTRRLTDQRTALTAAEVAGKLRAGTRPDKIVSAATTTSAGAVLLSDPDRYTSLRELGRLTHVLGGAGVIDAGRADLILVARLADVESVPILVGRADVIGAEAVCAALGFLQRQGLPVQPVVVLSSTTPTDRRRVHAAVKLVATAGVIHLVHLPHDAQLATGRPVRLDQVSKTTAAACLRLTIHIAQTQEVLGYVSRRP